MEGSTEKGQLNDLIFQTERALLRCFVMAASFLLRVQLVGGDSEKTIGVQPSDSVREVIELCFKKFALQLQTVGGGSASDWGLYAPAPTSCWLDEASKIEKYKVMAGERLHFRRHEINVSSSSVPSIARPSSLTLQSGAQMPIERQRQFASLRVHSGEQVFRVSIPDAALTRIVKCDAEVTNVTMLIQDLISKGHVGQFVIGDSIRDYGLFCPDRGVYLSEQAVVASFRFPPVQALIFRRKQWSISVVPPAEAGGEILQCTVSVHATMYDVHELVMTSFPSYTDSRGGASQVRADHALFLQNSKGQLLGLRLEPHRTIASYRLKSTDFLVWSTIPRDELSSSRASLEKYNDTMFVKICWPSEGVSKTLKVRAASMTVEALIDVFLDRTGTVVRDPLTYGLIMASSIDGTSRRDNLDAFCLRPKATLIEAGCTNLCELHFRQRRKPRQPTVGARKMQTIAPGRRRSVFKFGVDSACVEVLLPNTNGMLKSSTTSSASVQIPSLLQQLRLLLRRHNSTGYRCEGIFRVAASESHASECKGIMNSGVDLLDVADVRGETIGAADVVSESTLELFEPHVIATLLKRWFGQLEPRVFDLSARTITADEIKDAVAVSPSESYLKIAHHLQARQPRLADLYCWLLDTLSEVVLHQRENLMSAANIAIVVGPQLVSIDGLDPMDGLTMSGDVVHLLQLHLVQWLSEKYDFEESSESAARGGFAGFTASSSTDMASMGKERKPAKHDPLATLSQAPTPQAALGVHADGLSRSVQGRQCANISQQQQPVSDWMSSLADIHAAVANSGVDVYEDVSHQDTYEYEYDDDGSFYWNSDEYEQDWTVGGEDDVENGSTPA